MDNKNSKSKQTEEVDVNKVKADIMQKEDMIDTLEEQIQDCKDASKINELDSQIMDLEDEIKELQQKIRWSR